MAKPPLSLHQQVWSKVLCGVMAAFDEYQRDEPSAEARETAEIVFDELTPLVRAWASASPQPEASADASAVPQRSRGWLA